MRNNVIMERLIFILMLVPLLAFADGSVRYWDEGALRWSDFTGNPVMKTTPTYFKGRLVVKSEITQEEKSRFNIETTVSTYAFAEMDKTQSYADTAYRSSQMLRYHQLQFDLLELMRRRLQADLNTGMTGIEADKRVAYYQNLYDGYIADIAKRTVNGSNDNRLQEEEYFVRKQLDEFLLPAVPEVKPGKFSYGWYIGTGALIPTGEIADAFGYAWLFNIGLTAGYDRLFLKADISYGQPRLDDMRGELFGREKEWAVNRYANQLSGVVALGYRVLDTKRFAITVNVGGGWTNYAWDVADFVVNTDNPGNNPETEFVRNSEIRRNTIHNFNYMAGLDFDWNFHTVVSDKPFFLSGRREQYTSSLRLSPYFMHQKYSKLSPQRSGYQVGIMLTYSGIARALGLK